MSADVDPDIPGTGAVFTFGKSKFADNVPSHFFIKNDPIVDIACGDQHTAVVCQNGRVFTFGSNEWGQLGLGHSNPVYKPSCLKSIKMIKCANVALGRAHTLIRTGEGDVYSCGANSEGQLGTGDTESRTSPQHLTSLHNVTAVSAGSNHSVAVTNSGEVYVWGSNTEGQIGLGQETSSSVLPTKLIMSALVLSVSAGYYHTLVLTETGSIWSFGEGDGGRLGLGLIESTYHPSQIDSVKDVNFKSMAAGGSHSVAIDDEGRLYVWGNNDFGQLGLESEVPSVLEPTPCLTEKLFHFISAGQQHSAFITDDGSLLMCGDTHHGKLGTEWTQDNYLAKPSHIAKLISLNVLKVACGGCHTAVLAAPRSHPVCQIFIENADIPQVTTKTLPPLVKKVSDPALLNPPDQVLSPPMNHIGPPTAKIIHLQLSSEEQEGSEDSEVEEEPMRSSRVVTKHVEQAWQLNKIDTIETLTQETDAVEKNNHINNSHNNETRKEQSEGKISRFFSRLRKSPPTKNADIKQGSNGKNIESNGKDVSSVIISHEENDTASKKSKMCIIL